MTTRLSFLFALAALVVFTWSTRAGATRRALVIGDNAGAAADTPLRFAEDDAASVATTLEELGTVRREDVTLLTASSLDRVRAAVRDVAQRTQPDDELVFFFSGHGGADGVHVAGQVWPWSEVRAELDAVPARLVVALVDACFSGALLTPKGLVRDSPLVVTVAPLGARGHHLITSSGANELSYESGLIQGSPFAEALRSGLRGAADTNHDGAVTLPELYDYIYGRTLSATLAAPTGPQHPLQSVRLESAGEVVLVQLRRLGTASVHGAAGLGRCYVLDPDGSRVLAELERPAEEAFLPRGNYVIKCVRAEQVLVARGALGAAPLSLDGLHYDAEASTGQLAKGPGGASESRFSAALGLATTESGGALLLGYEGGSRDLLWSVEAGATWTGAALLAAGIGTHVPWWRVGESGMVLGLEAAGSVDKLPSGVAVGAGSFVELESPSLAGSLRTFFRLDLMALEPVTGGALEATLVGSVGARLGR